MALTADVLREQIPEEPQARASSPAPGPAPDTLNLPGSGALSTPVLVPQPIQNGLPGLVDGREIASHLFGVGGAQARVVEAAEAKSRGMAPQIDTVTAAINAPAPVPPPAPPIGTPPSLGMRPFLASSEGESPIASLQKLVTGLGQFAIGLGGGSGRAKASLAALTGAMAGWQAGERERADRDFADWKANSDAALQTWNNQNKEYENVLKARGLSLDEKMTGLKLAALKYDNDIAVAQLAEGDLAKFLMWQTGREDAARNYEIESGKLVAQVLKARTEGRKEHVITDGDKQYLIRTDPAGNITKTLIGDKREGAGTLSERVASAQMDYQQNPTPENAQKLATANQAMANEERISGGRAIAQALAALQVGRGAPLTPKEAENLINPRTLTGPPPGLTMNDAIAQGYREVDAKDREALADLKSVEAIVGTLTAMTQKLITATDLGSATQQWGSLTEGAKTGRNPLARTYAQTRDSFLGTVSRALAGERGVLTNQDLTRISNAFPGFFDTRAVADAKEGMLRLLIDTASRARIAKMTGQAFDQGAFRSQIDTIITNLEAAGPSAPGAVRVPTAPQTVPAPGQPGSPWVKVPNR